MTEKKADTLQLLPEIGQQGCARNLKKHNQLEKLFVKNAKYTKYIIINIDLNQQ